MTGKAVFLERERTFLVLAIDSGGATNSIRIQGGPTK